MKVIGQVGPSVIIIGISERDALVVSLRDREARGPVTLYSITGRMQVEDVTLDDTSVELALRLAEQHMKP